MDQEGKNFIDISHENLVLDCQKGIVILVYNNFNYYQLSQSSNYFSPLQVLTVLNNH